MSTLVGPLLVGGGVSVDYLETLAVHLVDGGFPLVYLATLVGPLVGGGVPVIALRFPGNEPATITILWFQFMMNISFIDFLYNCVYFLKV